MNAKITWAVALASCLAGQAVRAEEPAATQPAAAAPADEPRNTFWGNEVGRPYEEIDSYIVPSWAPSAPLQLVGYTWTDVGYLNRRNTQSGQYNQNIDYSQGRLVLGAKFRRELGGLFAEARAQLVAFQNEFTKSQYEPHTQDAYIRVGGRTWDVQVGRFLGWEPYYRGIGFDRYSAEESGALGGPSMYRLDAALGHFNEPGQAALHLYPVDWAALELSAVYGQQSEQNNEGGRAVLALRKYGFLLIGGYEYLKETPQSSNNKVEQTSKGYAGRLQYTYGPCHEFGCGYYTLGVDASKERVDAVQIDGLVDAAKTFDKTTVGAVVEADFWDNVVGAGYHLTTADLKKGETNKHHQAFVAYVYKLPITGLTLKAVYGWGKAELQDVDANTAWENDLRGFRVRLRYDFR